MAAGRVHWIFLFGAKIALTILIPPLEKPSLLYYDSQAELLASTHTKNSMITTLYRLPKCWKHRELSISSFRKVLWVRGTMSLFSKQPYSFRVESRSTDVPPETYADNWSFTLVSSSPMERYKWYITLTVYPLMWYNGNGTLPLWSSFHRHLPILIMVFFLIPTNPNWERFYLKIWSQNVEGHQKKKQNRKSEKLS